MSVTAVLELLQKEIGEVIEEPLSNEEDAHHLVELVVEVFNLQSSLDQSCSDDDNDDNTVHAVEYPPYYVLLNAILLLEVMKRWPQHIELWVTVL